MNGVRLYFDVEGCGLAARDRYMAARPTIVLLHGGPGADHSLFKPEFSAMADAAQVVYLDQRGSGRSDHGDPDLWTWDQWADDVAGFCRALDIAAPVLVGTSGGGRVAVACAGQHPGVAAALVLDSTLFGPGSLEDSWRSSSGAAARRPGRRRRATSGATRARRRPEHGPLTQCRFTGARPTATWPRAAPGCG